MSIDQDIKTVEKEIKRRGRPKGSKNLNKSEMNQQILKGLYDSRKEIKEASEEVKPKRKWNYVKKSEIVLCDWSEERKTVERIIETDFEGIIIVPA